MPSVEQLAEKLLCEVGNKSQGLKPAYFLRLTAQLKSCPDTKP